MVIPRQACTLRSIDVDQPGIVAHWAGGPRPRHARQFAAIGQRTGSPIRIAPVAFSGAGIGAAGRSILAQVPDDQSVEDDVDALIVRVTGDAGRRTGPSSVSGENSVVVRRAAAHDRKIPASWREDRGSSRFGVVFRPKGVHAVIELDEAGPRGREPADTSRLVDRAADAELARGQLMHARFLADRTVDVDPVELDVFEHAARLCRRACDRRGEGEALLWVGCFHQVVRGDQTPATEALTAARACAQDSEDKQTLSYVLRHLGIAEHMEGRLESSASLLEKSTALRRELDLPVGVAANLVGLAYIVHGRGDDSRAAALLREAEHLTDVAGAAAIREQVDQARTELSVAG